MLMIFCEWNLLPSFDCDEARMVSPVKARRLAARSLLKLAISTPCQIVAPLTIKYTSNVHNRHGHDEKLRRLGQS
jgi:hypothetical protein